MKNLATLKISLQVVACLFLAVLFIGCQGNRKNGMNAVIALITDFGSADAYVPQMKGAILTVNPEARIIDLTHDLGPHQLFEASYLLHKATATLPSRTVICAVIDPGVGSARRGIALQTTTGRIYVGPDNGIFSHVLKREGLTAAVVLDRPQFYRTPDPSATFHGRDIFGPAAAHLTAGLSLTDLGTPTRELEMLDLPQPTTLGTKITGQVVHIDHFGNIITNIHRKDVPDTAFNQLIKVNYRNRTLTLPVVSTYAEAPPKRLFALFNSDNEFEIALKESPAAKTLKPTVGDPIVLLLK